MKISCISSAPPHALSIPTLQKDGEFRSFVKFLAEAPRQDAAQIRSMLQGLAVSSRLSCKPSAQTRLIDCLEGMARPV